MKHLKGISELYKHTLWRTSNKLKDGHTKRAEDILKYAHEKGEHHKVNRIYVHPFDFSQYNFKYIDKKIHPDAYKYYNRFKPYLIGKFYIIDEWKIHHGRLRVKFESNYKNSILLDVGGVYGLAILKIDHSESIDIGSDYRDVYKFKFENRKDALSFKSAVHEMYEDEKEDPIKRQILYIYNSLRINDMYYED